MSQFDFGSGLMIGTPLTHIDGSSVSTPTPVEFGIMQDVSIEIDAPLKQLYGTYQFPVALGRGKAKVSGKARSAQIEAALWGSLFFGQTSMPATGETLISYRQAGTIPASPTYTLTPTVPSSGTWAYDLGVRFAATGLALQNVSSLTATGQYTVASGVYTFDSVDASLGVLISYGYTISGGFNLAVANQLLGNVVTWKASFQGVWSGKSISIILNNCVSEKITFATKLDDFVIPEFDFEAFADASNNIMTISMSEY